MTKLISMYSVVVYPIQYTRVPIQLSPMKVSARWLIPVILKTVPRQPRITLEPNGDTAMVKNVHHRKAQVKLDGNILKNPKECSPVLHIKYLKGSKRVHLVNMP